MNKTISELIDELTITNIKIYYLERKKNNTYEVIKKLHNLKAYRAKLAKSIDKLAPIEKSIGTLIDELTITNIKIFMLVDKVLKNKHTKEDAKKIQDLNIFRSKLANGINRIFKEKEIVKV